LLLATIIDIFASEFSACFVQAEGIFSAAGVQCSMLTYKELSKLFSSRRISEFSLGNETFLLRVANHYIEHLENNFTAADVFDICYKDISENYRAEYFYKNTVAEKILIGRHSLNTATAISEFRVGKSKADCVIINGHSTCYEIKSEFDNLDRLENQLTHYQKIFDRVYVVTASNHLKHISDRENKNIGIIELTKRNTLKTIREATIENREIDVKTLIRSLRVGEYTEIVNIIYGSIPKVSNTEIFSECEKLLLEASPLKVREAFCKTIKKTRKSEKEFITKLPKSLLIAGISYKLTKQNKVNLVNNLNKTISKDTICTTLY
jgi:hypothetical protein